MIGIHRFKLFLLLFWTSLPFLIFSQKTNYSDSISINFFLLDECRICQYYGPQIAEFQKENLDGRFHFIGYFPNFSSKKENIDKFKLTYQLNFDLKTDYTKRKSKFFDVKILPTVVVYDEKNQQILYKGRIDNAYYGVGRQRKVVTTKELSDVLQAITNNQTLKTQFEQPIGCFINFTDNISNSLNN